jgi:hypothetical protein
MSVRNTNNQDNAPVATSESDVNPSIPTTTSEPAIDAELPIGSTAPIIVSNPNFPNSLDEGTELFLGNDGSAYLRRSGSRAQPVLRIGSRSCDAYLRRLAHEEGRYPRAADLVDINNNLIARAEFSGDRRSVWYRVAQIPGGIEIDLGGADLARVRVTAGNVSILTEGSETLFCRTQTMEALPTPAAGGDIRQLYPFLNLSDQQRILATGWISFTLGNPKTPTTSFPPLSITGEQGDGKSELARNIQRVIDPSKVGLQTFPRDGRDLAIAAQNAHLLLFDNVRGFSPSMSDTLCVASTGGAYTTRRLYSDADQLVLPLHVALVLNGLHAFVDQPDLAQRCVPLTMRTLEEADRRSQSSLRKEFELNLPQIFRGLLNLIAGIFQHLPHVEVTSPERMIDFSRWLAAMELVDGLQGDPYQSEYSAALKASMLDSLLEDPLAAPVLALVGDAVGACWSGAPAELLRKLDASATRRTPHPRGWPENEIALSKRLKALRVAFRRQGVDIRLSRSRTRVITITRVEEVSHD